MTDETAETAPDDPDDRDLTVGAGRGAGRRRTAGVNRWFRWLHVYTSMFSLLVVFFFGITGLTLNHPSWTLGDNVDRTVTNGTLPSGWQATDGDPDFLAISEFVRSTYDVGGEVADHGISGGEAYISYKGPGYGADVFVDTETGTFELVVEAQGWVGVLNDLHKGRDTSDAWSWVIDLSAVVLVLVSVTGLGIQLFQRKRRTRAVVAAAAGGVLAVVVMIATLA